MEAQFIVAFTHKHLRHLSHYGPFQSAEDAIAWGERKKDEFWVYYQVVKLIDPDETFK